MFVRRDFDVGGDEVGSKVGPFGVGSVVGPFGVGSVVGLALLIVT